MDQFTAPFGQIIELRQILHDSGVRLLRVIVREEGKYYTIDLDPATAHQWGKDMVTWAEDYSKSAG
jgi:hypothetical protein